jgi:hypothetical protein
MLSAILHGKLSREIDGMEDVLTSCAFGVLGVVAPSAGLLPFLARSASVDDGRPLRGLALETVDVVSIEFWPAWKEAGCEFCEPDVVLRIDSTSGGRRLLVLVEAKHRSGKSSFEDHDATSPNDQLACEWDNLRLIAAREGREPHLIYLTADFSFPAKDILEAKQDFQRYRKTEPFECSWLGWHQLPDSIRTENCETTREAAALVELRMLLQRLGLLVPEFHGVPIPEWQPQASWGFKA